MLKVSARMRMNYNLHQSLEDKCHRMLNAVEPGTVVPIHRHPTKNESFVILRGKVRVTTHKDEGAIMEDVGLRQESGSYGVDIPKNVWHMVEALEAGSGRFECEEGAVGEHEGCDVFVIGMIYRIMDAFVFFSYGVDFSLR
ncbi:MAG: WbuC family cupin fold metalloprotein [Bacteroidota bacterium]|nr:WbuC family cupin fold metalloprotein [Bacteroidota bacterium]